MKAPIGVDEPELGNEVASSIGTRYEPELGNEGSHRCRRAGTREWRGLALADLNRNAAPLIGIMLLFGRTSSVHQTQSEKIFFENEPGEPPRLQIHSQIDNMICCERNFGVFPIYIVSSVAQHDTPQRLATPLTNYICVFPLHLYCFLMGYLPNVTRLEQPRFQPRFAKPRKQTRCIFVRAHKKESSVFQNKEAI
jgi:hypothetical protein